MNSKQAEAKSRVLALAEKGYGYKKIATLVGDGISPYTVRGWLRKYGPKKAEGLSRSRTLTEEDKAEIRRLYKEGVTVAALAERFSRSKRTIRDHLKPPRPKTKYKQIFDSAVLERACRLFENGYHLKEIATSLGISENCARSWRLEWRTGRLQQRAKEGLSLIHI